MRGGNEAVRLNKGGPALEDAEELQYWSKVEAEGLVEAGLCDEEAASTMVEQPESDGDECCWLQCWLVADVAKIPGVL